MKKVFFNLCQSVLICGFYQNAGAQMTGVPLGGIGAGSIRIEADGRFRGVSLFGETRPTGEEFPGSFLALWTETPTRTTAEVLTSTPACGLPISVMSPTFSTAYPFAVLAYPDAARPVSVTLTAFSPFIPYDLRNSSFPGFIVQCELKNETNEPVEVSAALSMQNLIGNGDARYTPVPAAEGNFGGTFTDPKLGAMTVQVGPPRGGAIVTQTDWKLSEDLTQLPSWWANFAKDGKVIVSPPGMILVSRKDTKTQKERWVNSSVLSVLSENKSESIFAPLRLCVRKNSVSNARPTPNACVLVVRLTLKPRERLEIPFAVNWSPPRVESAKTKKSEQTTDTEFSLTPAQIFPDSLLSARELLNQRLPLKALTEEWQNRLRTSNLPQGFQTALINSLMPLTTNVKRAADAPTVFLVNGEAMATPVQSKPALLALEALFPVLLSAPLDDTARKRNDLSEPLALFEREQPDAALKLFEKNEKNTPSIQPEANALAPLATWQILSALWGFEHRGDEIVLTPRLPGTWRSLRAPIFAFGFWGYSEFVPRARGYSLSFRLDRTFAVPLFDSASGKKNAAPAAAPDLTLASLVLPAPPRIGENSPTIYARLRQSALGLKIIALPDNKIRVTFDTPLHLVAGDRIDLEAK